MYIDELKSIEQEIRKISHDLNSDFIEGSSYFDIIKTLVENRKNKRNKSLYMEVIIKLKVVVTERGKLF